MSGLDAATWQALGLVLTLLGLGTSAYVWSRRGPARGLRGVAWSLVPLAAALTGTLRLVGDVVGAVGRWSSRLVLDPLTWTGIVVAGVSALLFVVSGRLIARDPRPRRGTRGGTAESSGSARVTARLGSRTSAPRASTPTAPPSASAGSTAPGASGYPEMDEIEAILRRRGIT
jgi:hypothetical protein